MTYESRVISQAGQDQLDSISAKFEEWRHQKTSRSARIPEALLHEAHKLTQHLGATAVRRRLGITKGQLDKLDATKQPDKATHDIDFMQLVPTHKPSQHPELSVAIYTSSGVKISLSGLAHKDPLALIAKLIDMPAC